MTQRALRSLETFENHFARADAALSNLHKLDACSEIEKLGDMLVSFIENDFDIRDKWNYFYVFRHS